MSGFPSNPPTFQSNVYNPSFYPQPSDTLTFADAELAFVKLFDPRLSPLTGVVSGVASANKALIIDSDLNISGINQIDCQEILINGVPIGQANNTFTSDIAISNSAINYTFAENHDLLYASNGNSAFSLRSIKDNQFQFNALGSSAHIDFRTQGVTRLSIRATGDVGIGTTSPGYKLDVAGSINISSDNDYYVGGATLRSILQTQNDARYVGINLNGGDGFMYGARTIQHIAAVPLTLKSTGSNVGLTLSNSVTDWTIRNVSDGSLQFYNASNDDTTLGITSSSFILFNRSYRNIITNNTTSLSIFQRWVNSIETPIEAAMWISNVSPMFGSATNHHFRLMSNGTERVRITSAGDVGIGLTNPAYKLDVAGSINISSANDYYIGGASLRSILQTQNDARYVGINLNGGDGIMFGQRTIQHIGNNNLRLKTTASSANSNIVFENDNRTYELGLRGSNSNPANSLFMYDNAAAQYRFVILPDGNVGLGTISPAYKLDVSGDINCTGTIRLNGVDITSTQQSNVFVPADSTIGSFSVSGLVYYVNGGRLFGTRLIDSNTLGMLSYSAGGAYSDYITWNHNGGAPIYALSARTVDILQSDLANGSSMSITIGKQKGEATNQAMEIVYNQVDTASPNNRLDIKGYNGNTLMSITAGGRVGINQTAPTCPLDVNGSASVTLAPSSFTNGYSYNISTGTWTNLGIGPIVVTLAARIRSNLWVQDKLYCSSDRRLKKDIQKLDFELEHYKKLNPVSYSWKNSNNNSKCLGLIAQEVRDICGEAVSYMPNVNVKKEEENDPEGVILTVDYNCINMMNVVAIQKLIEKMESLEYLLFRISERPAVKNWLKKNS